jgi:hypothetical protein
MFFWSFSPHITGLGGQTTDSMITTMFFDLDDTFLITGTAEGAVLKRSKPCSLL